LAVCSEFFDTCPTTRPARRRNIEVMKSRATKFVEA
jgi:hypothetical protein